MNHEGHDEREGIRNLGMRLPSPLSDEAERAMTDTIGCAIAVHKALGPGYLESIYQKAMRVEFEAHGIGYESEKSIVVNYRGVQIHAQRVDLIVRGLIVVELKAVTRFDEIHRAQVISYLRTTGLRAGLLINFRARLLKAGLQRIVLSS
jgi:GxxExxY protein